jgi:heme exporter protein CcmB
MSIFLIILKQEFTLAGRNLAKIFQNFLFFFISFAVFFLISQNQQNQLLSPYLTIDAILFCLIFSLIFSNSDFLFEDFSDGTLEQIIISQPNLEIFVLAKMLGNWLIFSLPILISIPLISIGIGLNQNFMTDFFILTTLASLTINFICAFCGSLSIAQNKAPMIAVLALPLIIPVLLIACGSFSTTEISDEDFRSALKILLGICVFVGSICVLGTTKIIKIVSE